VRKIEIDHSTYNMTPLKVGAPGRYIRVTRQSKKEGKNDRARGCCRLGRRHNLGDRIDQPNQGRGGNIDGLHKSKWVRAPKTQMAAQTLTQKNLQNLRE
jgi:hypothetical protein